MAKKSPQTEEGEAEILPPLTAEEKYEIRTKAPAHAIWSYDDTGHDLTVEQQLFCRSYIIDRNPVAALLRLNYAGETPKLKRIADKFLTNTEVQGCIQTLAARLMEKMSITAERVQGRIASVAFFDPRSIMQFDTGGVILLDSRFWTEDQARNIQSIKHGKDGVEIKFYDGLRASEMLAKQLGVQPDESAEAAATASKAAAEAVVNKIFDIFDRTVEDPALPAPEVKH